jgi:hypothetical protein
MADRLDYDPGLGDEEVLPPRRRGPNFALIVAVVVLLLAGLWIGHRLMQRGGGAGNVPVLHADTRPIKIKPTDPGGMDVPDQDMQILNPQKGGSKVEQLLPPPETPLPRPAPAAPPPPPVTPAQPAETPPGPPPSLAPDAAPPAAVPATPTTPIQAPAAAQSPAQTQEAAVPAGGVRLQLGAVHTTEAAQQEWERLKHAHPDLLGNLGFTTSRVDLGERGIYFRILAGPIADPAQADHICAELKQRKLGCILVKP